MTGMAALSAHLWSSTLFLLLVLAIVAILRKRLTASARFSLAFIGILKFAIPGSLLTPLFRAAGAPQPLRIPLPILRTAAVIDATPATSAIWPTVAAAVWAVIALVLMLRFALTRRRLVTLSVRTALPPEEREVEALARAKRFIGVRGSIDIARSALPEAPAVLRILRPLIVLPIRGCGDLSDGELESLLRHECAHVARHDNLIARIESIICALFWFHPLIWIAQRITVIERERACDERVAASAEERETYLAALTKFCHAAIAPRLPGVSCMATAKLKERIDHVMNYETLQRKAPSTKRVAAAAVTALVLFTVASAMVGSDRIATAMKDPYAVRVAATRSGDTVTLQATVHEIENGTIVAAPVVNFPRGGNASAKAGNGGLEVVLDAQPDSGDRIRASIAINRHGRSVQTTNILVTPTDAAAKKYSGDPISLQLKDVELRDVIGTFGKLTGLEMKIDENVKGTVSVNWHNVPWDEAFESLLNENGCTYRIEGKTMIVSKK